MLDWYQGKVGYSGRGLRLNRLLEVTPDGEVTFDVERPAKVTGSFESSIQLRRDSASPDMVSASERYNLLVNQTCLYMSGNPSKFLQGHNVFGPNVRSLGPVLTATIRELPPEVRPEDADNPLPPAVHRNRVDISTSVHLGKHSTVHEWLRTVARSSSSRHKGTSMVSGDTVYWGKHSSRWSIKAYCKFCELDAHPPKDLKQKDRLKQFCEGHLRLELTLRTLELKNRGTLDETLVWEYFQRINIGSMELPMDKIESAKLSRSERLTLNEWLARKEVKYDLPRRTFYRHRKAILDATGLDISLPVPDESKLKAVKFDLDYLVANEIKEIPSTFQGHLFKAEESRQYSAR
jgi:phage/plasmid replication protein, gene II/X family